MTIEQQTNIYVCVLAIKMHCHSMKKDDLSHIMRKPDFCICDNKGADQLCSNCTADQRLCFHYSDSTIPLLLLAIPVNTHESIVFDKNSSTGIHHTHELAKIAKKHNFTSISRLEFPSAIFVYDCETAPSGKFLNLANTRDKNT